MSKIMRQLEAEARAAREAEQRRKEAMDRCASDCPEPCAACLMDPSTVWVSASDIGADVPSAPNDPPLEHWWQYAHVIGHITRQGGEDG